MKRSKDDEKNMGPMFPRLHINDKEKGGPRAPPRNKMALYEQLSIPSQRYNPGVLPFKPNTISNVTPTSSLSQRAGHERDMQHPVHSSLSAPAREPEQFHTHSFGRANFNSSLAQSEQRKVLDEDDFSVPVFVQSRMGQCKTQNDIKREKLTSHNPKYSGCSTNGSDKGQAIISPDTNCGEDVTRKNEENPKLSGPSRSHSEKSSSSVSKDSQDPPDSSFGKLSHNGTCLQHRPDSHSQQNRSNLNEPVDDGKYCTDGISGSVQRQNVDKSVDVSESSMVESVLEMDISPDDVVGIIGQKHFWKARRAIVNQQRVFAVQVFELHRLIKVQQLIASSPHVLVEDAAFLGNASHNQSDARKLTSEYIVKPLPAGVTQIINCNENNKKPNNKVESSAENALAKTSVSSAKNGNNPSTWVPYSEKPLLAPPAIDNKPGSSYYFPHQSPGQQWLVPVMSPSEGLVYKPYPGPGFVGPGCGGCGPYGLPPLTSNFINPSYGVPTSHHQGIEVFPGTSPVGHPHFFPYGMPIMSPPMSGSTLDQMNLYGQPCLTSQNGQISSAPTAFRMQHQSSGNMPIQKNGDVPVAINFQVSGEVDLRVSNASSAERTRRNGTDDVARGRAACSVFPAASVIESDIDQPTPVIKVVPHNAISATESAARIFQSIQDERKQNESF